MDKLTQGYGLIEGPVWDPARGLLFSDVQFGGVFAITAAGEVSTVFEHRKGIGGMAMHEAGGLIVAGRNIAFKPADGGATVVVHEKSEAAGEVGFNDLTTDSAGRLYVGTIGIDPLAEVHGEPNPGQLWMIDLDGSAQVVGTDVLLTNGLASSPDGRTLYHSDSQRQMVMQYSVNDDGTLGDKREFAPTERGAPDGLVVSEDGAVWVALASGGGAVAVYEASGELRSYIDIPLPMCTSLCFGGDDLRDLYIVTGSSGADSDRAGSVFVTRTDVAGLPVPVCKVALATG